MRILYCLLFATVLCGCASQRAVSTIVSIDYDAKKDITSYMVLPYGSVDIPGKWTKGGYNSSSKQQFFMNNDSISIAVGLGAVDKYEFNYNGKLNGLAFLNAFYE